MEHVISERSIVRQCTDTCQHETEFVTTVNLYFGSNGHRSANKLRPTFADVGAPAHCVPALASASGCRYRRRRRHIRRRASVHSDDSTGTVNAIDRWFPKRWWSMMKMVRGSFPDKLRWYRRGKSSRGGRDSHHGPN
jgi:hypothetical protein